MRKFLRFMSLVLMLIALSWGVDPARAQSLPTVQSPQGDGLAQQIQGQIPNLNNASEQAAAARAAQGMMRGVTNAQRQAAAERAAARRAAAATPTTEGGTK